MSDSDPPSGTSRSAPAAPIVVDPIAPGEAERRTAQALDGLVHALLIVEATATQTARRLDATAPDPLARATLPPDASTERTAALALRYLDEGRLDLARQILAVLLAR